MSTARSVRSFSQSIGSSAKVRALRVALELAYPVGPVEVREHQDVEQLGAGSRTEGIQSLLESAFELVVPHRATACSRKSRSRRAMLES